MKRFFVFTIVGFFLIYQVNLSRSLSLKQKCTDDSSLSKGEGCFIYQNKTRDSQIPVYYYLPEQVQKNTKVLFVLHGEQRNAEDYRNDWRKIYHNINNPNLIVLAPKFKQKWFPKTAGYNLGNLFTENLETLKPQNQWAFTQIEKIFELLKKTNKIEASNYYLYGHSAGAQFVHRLIIFTPNAHIKKAIAAEAGSYTIPTQNINYPCGLGTKTGEQLPFVDLKTTFQIPMTILLGKKDNRSLSSQHDTYKCDTQQGANRLERGEYFYKQAKSISNSRNEVFNWTIKEVNAAHIVANTYPPIEDSMLVSCAALEFFPGLKGVYCQ